MIRKVMRSSIVLLLTAVLTVSFFMPALLRADDSVSLSLDIPDTEVNPGDIITVNVVADSLEHVTRFGPINLGFNQGKVEYLSIWQPAELSAFTYTTEVLDTGRLVVSAVDELTEADLNDILVQEGEITDDVSFYTDEPIILFSASFRMKPTATGEARFWIAEADDFRTGMGDEMNVVIGDGITVTSDGGISTDSSIVSMSIDGVTLTPEFSPDVYTYTASVNREITSLDITTVPGNLWAAVSIDGDTNLELGENVVTIDVVAQDGSNTSQYLIYVTRQDSAVLEGSGVVDAFGKSYAFINFPEDYEIPEGFTQTTKTINGFTVPCFSREGVLSVLVYLYDGENDPGFYFYNPSTRTITPYVKGNTIIRPGVVMSMMDIPEDVTLPSGLTPETIQINGQNVAGFRDKEGAFIVYLKDENGNAGFFRFDEETGMFYEYVQVDRTAEKIFRVLFRVFMWIAIIESVMIVVIIYVVRKVIKKKTQPRPKRV
ncbi:MAG: cadherin-like beta sandwich domain-containing protein [Clostridiales bacterium]|nr:cadherin-like beta sandwich domain-containing protein [Clostridiales bacterium]